MYDIESPEHAWLNITNKDLKDINENEMILDIGIKTISHIKKHQNSIDF